MGGYVIVNVRTGQVTRGYTHGSARNAIAWAWNTGGEIDHLQVYHERDIPERFRRVYGELRGAYA